MKILPYLSLIVSTLFLYNPSLHAQRNCGAMDYLNYQIQKDPNRAVQLDAIEKQTQQILKNGSPEVDGIITIPVVVHVIYNNATQNISDAQIQSQIQVLNDDFRRTNSDADNTWSQAADSEIEFCLATTDPNGNPSTGITRTSTSVTSFSTNDNMKFDASGGKDAWPAGEYLNIWVCNIGGGILGYAQFPGGPANTDGVVCGYQYFGTTGTATTPFHLGRTTTHEVGHWLNLRHIWGDGNCSADDFVGDTPSSDAPNYGCALGHVSCTTTDMVQNYMDYSDDACMNLYTLGQKNRMRALFDPSGARASLLNSNGCGTATTPTCTDGIQNGDETGIDCGGTNCPPCENNCNDNYITFTLTLDNYPTETSWQLLDEAGNILFSGSGYTTPNQTITENYCLPDGCYDFVINDSYGDGICCSFGQGSFTFNDETGTTLISGGTFQQTETSNFCLNSSVATCSDNIQNGDETGVDCGGTNCPPCETVPTCSDGIQNGDETGIDCGGTNCPPCDTLPTCSDGIQNGDETGIDCGGTNCPPCETVPTCSDGIQNGDETGIDCGGTNCPPCDTSGCATNSFSLTLTLDNYPAETSWEITDDSGTILYSGGNYTSKGETITLDFCEPDGCFNFTIYDTYGDGICCQYGQGSYNLSTAAGAILASGGAFTQSEMTSFCLGQAAPSCSDGLQNGDETGIDCGGTNCPPCDTTCNLNTVTLTLTLDNYPSETSWTVNDSAGNVLYSGGDYSVIGATITETFCLPNGCYSFNIADSYGDGICCSFGQGSYTLTAAGDNSTLASGGDFNQDETATFCLGSSAPPGCNGNSVQITIQTDNYPLETTWQVVSASGAVQASGGPYNASNETFQEDLCLPNGCYTFTINDSYGDGICCSYGQGSYTVTNLANSNVIASGGGFTNTESVTFCVPEQSATCSDGVQNGDETGIDCGGTNCPPCDSGCVYTTLYTSTFEYGWGIWEDGGEDCRRSSYDQAYANNGIYCVRVQDNSSSAKLYSDDLDLTNYSEVTLDYSFIMVGMENGEGFRVQYSTDDGDSYNTLHEVEVGYGYNNLQRYNESIVIPGPFSDETVFRFRGTGSSNNDRTYFDDIVISGCAINNRVSQESIAQPISAQKGKLRGELLPTTGDALMQVTLFPNPANERIQIGFDLPTPGTVHYQVTNVTGQLVMRSSTQLQAGYQQHGMDVSQLDDGIYFLQVETESARIVRRFIVAH